MDKITVKHFLNKELKPQIEKSKVKYPVYVQVIVLTMNLKFKSNNLFFEYLTEPDLDNEFVSKMLKEEKNTIEIIIRELINQDKRELITSKTLSLYTKKLSDVIDSNFCKLLLDEKKTKKFIPSLFLSATYSEINEVIFFYNDSSPFNNLSEKIHDCLWSINVIYNEITEGEFYVYDLFYGDKKKKIESTLDFSNNFNDEETKKMILTLQNLVIQ